VCGGILEQKKAVCQNSCRRALLFLMEREYKIKGTIEKIDMMDNYVIIKENEVA